MLFSLFFVSFATSTAIIKRPAENPNPAREYCQNEHPELGEVLRNVSLVSLSSAAPRDWCAAAAPQHPSVMPPLSLSPQATLTDFLHNTPLLCATLRPFLSSSPAPRPARLGPACVPAPCSLLWCSCVSFVERKENLKFFFVWLVTFSG